MEREGVGMEGEGSWMGVKRKEWRMGGRREWRECWEGRDGRQGVRGRIGRNGLWYQRLESGTK